MDIISSIPTLDNKGNVIMSSSALACDSLIVGSTLRYSANEVRAMVPHYIRELNVNSNAHIFPDGNLFCTAVYCDLMKPASLQTSTLVCTTISGQSANITGNFQAAQGSVTGNLAAGGKVSGAQAAFTGAVTAQGAQLSTLGVTGAMTGAQATFQGALAAAQGSFSGPLIATQGSLSGTLSVTGALTGSQATYSGAVIAASISGNQGTFQGTVAAAQGAFQGTVTAQAAQLRTLGVTEAVSAKDLALSGNLSVAGSTMYSGALSAPSATLGSLTVQNSTAMKDLVLGGSLTGTSATFTAKVAAQQGQFSTLLVQSSQSLNDVNVGGQWTGTSATLAGNLTAQGASLATLNVTAQATIKDLQVQGYLSGSSATLTGNLTTQGARVDTLTVLQSATLQTASVTGQLNAASAVVSGDITASGDISARRGTFSQQVSVGGGLAVQGTSSFLQSVQGTSLSLSGSLAAPSAQLATLSVTGTSNFGGTVSTTNGITVGGLLRSTGTARFEDVNSKVIQVDTLIVSGTAYGVSGGGAVTIDTLVGNGPGGIVTVQGYLQGPGANIENVYQDTIRVRRLLADEIVGGVIYSADPDNPTGIFDNGTGGGGGSTWGATALPETFTVKTLIGQGLGGAITVQGFLQGAQANFTNLSSDTVQQDTIRVRRLLADEIVGGVIYSADPDNPSLIFGQGGGSGGTGGTTTVVKDVQADSVRTDAVYAGVVEADEIYCPMIVGGTRVTAQCDRRVKDAVAPLSDVLAAQALSAVDAVTYLKDGEPEVGFIAQDVEAVLPAAVSTHQFRGIPDFKCLDVKAMVAVLWKVVQQQQRALDELSRMHPMLPLNDTVEHNDESYDGDELMTQPEYPTFGEMLPESHLLETSLVPPLFEQEGTPVAAREDEQRAKYQ